MDLFFWACASTTKKMKWHCPTQNVALAEQKKNHRLRVDYWISLETLADNKAKDKRQRIKRKMWSRKKTSIKSGFKKAWMNAWDLINNNGMKWEFKLKLEIGRSCAYPQHHPQSLLCSRRNSPRDLRLSVFMRQPKTETKMLCLVCATADSASVRSFCGLPRCSWRREDLNLWMMICKKKKDEFTGNQRVTWVQPG